MFQRATVDFMTRPDTTIATILSIIDKTKQGYTDSVVRSRQAVQVMREQGLVGNGKDRTVGEFDLTPGGRVDRLLKIDLPIFVGQRKQLAPNLSVASIATNEFIDPAIGLPAGK